MAKYPVIFDDQNGLQYAYQSQFLAIPTDIAGQITLTGQLTQASTFPASAGPHSYQGLATDVTLQATSGSSQAGNPKFLAAEMGVLHGPTLTATENYLAGDIGGLDAVVNGTIYPSGGLMGIIFDGSTGSDGAVVAVIDGNDPSSVTTSRAAYAVRMNNNNSGSGTQFGLDLYDPGNPDYSGGGKPYNVTKADLRLTNQVCVLNGVGAPTNGVTGATFAEIGSLYSNRTNGTIYSNTGTRASPVWTALSSGGGGPTFSDWTAYTPTFTGLGTVNNVQFFWQRIGNSIYVKGYVASGTVTGSTVTITLPSGAINYAKIPNPIASTSRLGQGERLTPITGGFGSADKIYIVFGDGTDTTHAYVARTATNNVYDKGTGSGIFNTQDSFAVAFDYPV
jgi:hypothetical protein